MVTPKICIGCNSAGFIDISKCSDSVSEGKTEPKSEFWWTLNENWVSAVPGSLIERFQTCLCIESGWFMTHYLNTQNVVNCGYSVQRFFTISWPIFKVKGSTDAQRSIRNSLGSGFLNFFFGVGEFPKTPKIYILPPLKKMKNTKHF